EESDSDEEMELHPLLTASLRAPITSKKKDVAPLEPPPLPPGWTAVNPDDTTGTNSFVSKADTFFADMNMTGQSMSYPPGYPGYPYTHPGITPPPPPPPGIEPQTGNGNPQFPPMFYSNNPAPSLAGPILSYPGTEMTTGPPIIPPPPDLKPICDKLAEYVARNGSQFEENIRAKNDPR
ncbi:splicing factor, suppressor of white-apricot homolog, partial [Paramuricea clavata]